MREMNIAYSFIETEKQGFAMTGTRKKMFLGEAPITNRG